MLLEARCELDDLRSEQQREKEGLLENVRQLTSDLRLQQLLIDQVRLSDSTHLLLIDQVRLNTPTGQRSGQTHPNTPTAHRPGQTQHTYCLSTRSDLHS